MCLAVPGKIVELNDGDPTFASAIVEFGGIRREVNVVCVPEAALGDYVMVHAGIAISRVDAVEAAQVLQTLRELDLEDTGFPEHDEAGPGVKPR
jgi:hydrogenase expression/formation protein HypC